MTRNIGILLSFISQLLFFSCTSSKIQSPQKEEIRLLFAGDIMAHTEITERDFSDAFTDIESLVRNADLAFANFESPVDDSRNQSSYPTFSCHSDFVQKAMDSGFNVFSLANNHTNDFHREGILATKLFFDSKVSTGIFSAGIKENEKDGIDFKMIEKNGFTVLFASVTEVLNFKTCTQMFDYVPPDEKGRQEFIKTISRKRRENPSALMILSFHTSEEEYVSSIAEKSKKFYYSLIDAGIDILWINHPHVPKEWNVITSGNSGNDKCIFYSVGNTISAQRRKPDFRRPDKNMENTGDSFLFLVDLKKDADGIRIQNLEPVIITTFINEQNNFVIKRLDDSFIENLKAQGNDRWASYLSGRKKIMEAVKGKSTWQ